MRFKAAVDKKQWFITPAIGVINERYYYGYPVIALGFAWLIWRCKVEFGVKSGGKTRKNNGN